MQLGFGDHLRQFAAHVFDLAVERSRSGLFKLILLLRSALQAALARGQAALHGYLVVGIQRGLIDGQHEQHIALPHSAAFGDMAFDDGGRLPRHEPDDTPVGDEVSRHACLARVFAQHKVGSHAGCHHQHERSEQRQRNRPEQLNAAQPSLALAVNCLGAEEVSHRNRDDEGRTRHACADEPLWRLE